MDRSRSGRGSWLASSRERTVPPAMSLRSSRSRSRRPASPCRSSDWHSTRDDRWCARAFSRTTQFWSKDTWNGKNHFSLKCQVDCACNSLHILSTRVGICRCRRCSTDRVAWSLLGENRRLDNAVARWWRSLARVGSFDVLHLLAYIGRLVAVAADLVEQGSRRARLEQTEGSATKALTEASLHGTAKRNHRGAVFVHKLFRDTLLHDLLHFLFYVGNQTFLELDVRRWKIRNILSPSSDLNQM